MRRRRDGTGRDGRDGTDGRSLAGLEEAGGEAVGPELPAQIRRGRPRGVAGIGPGPTGRLCAEHRGATRGVPVR